MRISRFFVDQPLATRSAVDIIDERAHYIRNVLRLNTGDPLVLFNGEGGEYRAILSNVTKKTVTAQIGDFNPINRNQPQSVTLGLAILKRDAMDLALQKAVELGVTFIQPLVMERVTVSEKQFKTRQNHWRSIAISSCEQCGLNLIPEILEPKDVTCWCASQTGTCLIADPDAELGPIRTVDVDIVSVLIGPEGGFSDSEVEHAKRSGFKGVNLGQRILRAETAAISLLALVNQSLLESDGTNL